MNIYKTSRTIWSKHPKLRELGLYHYQAKASWPCRGAIKSGRAYRTPVARFLAALVSAWHLKPHRRQEKVS